MRCKAVLLMDHSASFISAKNKSLKVIVMFIAALMTFLVMTEGFSADAAAAKLSTPKMTAQINYGSDFTHPYNKQTNTIKVHWSKVRGASSYELYIKGGKYKSWKKYKTVKNTNCTVTGLQRTTSYQFRVKAVNGSAASAYSKTQTIKTARMDFNKAGWEAMCRIVYHEVQSGISLSFMLQIVLQTSMLPQSTQRMQCGDPTMQDIRMFRISFIRVADLCHLHSSQGTEQIIQTFPEE